MILAVSSFSFPSKLNTLYSIVNFHITLDFNEVIPTQISVDESFSKFLPYLF